MWLKTLLKDVIIIQLKFFLKTNLGAQFWICSWFSPIHTRAYLYKKGSNLWSHIQYIWILLKSEVIAIVQLTKWGTKFLSFSVNLQVMKIRHLTEW